MQELIKKSGTVTSLELVAEINLFRNQDGNKSEIRHADLLKIIRDEFEEEINERKISLVEYTDKKGETRPMFELTISQATQVLVRESKFVRKAVIAKLEALQKPKEISRTDLAQMVIDSEKENQLLQIENQKLVGEVKTLEHKTEYTEKVLKTNNTLLATEVCKEFGLKSATEMNRKLVEKGIIYKIRGHFVINAKYAGKGYERYSEHQYNSKVDGTLKISRQLEWTQLGRAFLHSIFNKELSYSKSYTYPNIQLSATA